MNSESGPNWQNHIYTQLHERECYESLPFTSILDHVYELQTDVTSLKQMRRQLTKKQELQDGGSPQTMSPTGRGSISMGTGASEDVSDLKQTIKTLQGRLAGQERSLLMMDARVLNNETLLMNRESKVSSLNTQLSELRKDAELRQAYITALETKLGMVRSNVSDIEVRDKRIADLAEEVSRLTAELAGVRSSVQLGLGSSEFDTELNVCSDDLERPSIAWHIKTAALPPTAVQFSTDAHSGAANAVRYDPSGSAVVTAGGDGTVQFFHARTGKKGITLTASKQALLSLSFDPSGKFLSYGGVEKKVFIWRCMSSVAPRSYTLPGDVTSSCFVSQQQLLSICKVRGDSMFQLHVPEDAIAPQTVSSKAVFDSLPLAMDVSTMSSSASTVCMDKSMQYWSIGETTLNSVFRFEDLHEQRITSTTISGDGQSVLTSSWDGHLKVVDTRSKSISFDINAQEHGFLNKQEFTKACFSSDERYVACGDNNGKVFVYDLKNTSKPVSTVSLRQKTRNVPLPPIVAVTWNVNGRQLAAADKNGGLTLFEPLKK